MESLRKAIECCFGELKKKFLVLRGVRAQTAEGVEQIFKMCVVLHRAQKFFDGYFSFKEEDMVDAPLHLDANRIALAHGPIPQNFP